ncbi:hypothetical protein BH92_15385 [Rhodococcoides fascians A21d2]|uniref:hypothetical protein n=1 Tax=Nocardiaceae TaxID=85025 RepID=UPI0012D2B3F9|nr:MULTISPECIES: hypothetical protein [Rhodococcus]MDI9895085.1 hypothetical protein [Rhodococcus sp. IEGM 1381]QII01072.1 hypothetical protein BH92_15385 [Rhodococcus fascians A21d2]
MAIANGKLKSIFALRVAGTDYVSDITSFDLTSDEAESDSTTFAEYNAGANRAWTLTVNAAWDGGSAGSLHDYLWNNAGASAAFDIQPHAGTTSAAKPRYTGTVRIPNRPDISAEAGTDATFEFTFDVIGTPNKVLSGTGV